MACEICHTPDQTEFPSEIFIHAPRGWTDPCDTGAMAFPVLRICMNCGHVEFELDDQALRGLQEKYAGTTSKGLGFGRSLTAQERH